MKKIILIVILLFVQITASAKVILKDIEVGRVFLVDVDGCIYVSSGNHSIAKYSPTGKLLIKFGQKGEGPSDIKRLGWFAFNPADNNIYVTEFFGGNKWISRFSRDGKYLGEWSCDLDWKKWGALSFIKFDNNGNAYIQVENSHRRRYKDFTIGTAEKQLIKFSPQGKKLKIIYKFKADFDAGKGGKGNITIPFHNYLYWNIYNDKIIVRENGQEFIGVYDHKGNPEKKIIVPFEREKVTQNDLDKWEKRLKSIGWIKKGIAEGWFDLKYWKKNLPFPKYKPVSGSQLFVDSHGYLYNMKYPGSDSNYDSWARIDLSGNDFSFINLNTYERLLYVWGNYFFILQLDSENNYVVARLEEKEFLERKGK